MEHKRRSLHDTIIEKDRELFCKLLKSCNSVNTMDGYGKTPLYYAISNKRNGMVRKLLHHGADINCVDSDCHTAIYVAIGNDDIVLFNFLVAYGAKVREGENMEVAIRNGNISMVTALINLGFKVNGVYRGWRPIHWSIKYGRLDIFHELLNKDADINLFYSGNKSWDYYKSSLFLLME